MAIKKKYPHTFSVLAYQDSPFIEDCIISLLDQTQKSSILLVTSTPSEFLQKIAAKYDLPLYVNPESKGIASDWTFAYHLGETPYITLAHQDDIYFPGYTESCCNALSRHVNSLIAFCDYSELNNGAINENNPLLLVKKAILAVVSGQAPAISTNFKKKWMLSLGNPVCCPTVVYNKSNIGEFVFNPAYSMNLDWEALIRLAHIAGAFIYVKEKLVARRIHVGSASTAAIATKRRHVEDQQLFRHFWPRPVADFIGLFYAAAYYLNNRKI